MHARFTINDGELGARLMCGQTDRQTDRTILSLSILPDVYMCVAAAVLMFRFACNDGFVSRDMT